MRTNTQKLIEDVSKELSDGYGSMTIVAVEKAVTKALEGKVILPSEPTKEMFDAVREVQFTRVLHPDWTAFEVFTEWYKAMLNSTEGLSDE